LITFGANWLLLAGQKGPLSPVAVNTLTPIAAAFWTTVARLVAVAAVTWFSQLDQLLLMMKTPSPTIRLIIA